MEIESFEGLALQMSGDTPVREHRILSSGCTIPHLSDCPGQRTRKRGVHNGQVRFEQSPAGSSVFFEEEHGDPGEQRNSSEDGANRDRPLKNAENYFAKRFVHELLRSNY